MKLSKLSEKQVAYTIGEAKSCALASRRVAQMLMEKTIQDGGSVRARRGSQNRQVPKQNPA